MSLVDVIVGSALILIVFLALFGLLRTSLLISSSAKAKAGATAVASTQMEYIRSLPYESVGTVGGIPAGPVAQYATTTLNGIPYAVRTLVQYVDDPKDGSGTGDSNGVTTDYKRVRIATTYLFRGEEREVAIVSNVAPPSLETTTNGGTLRVHVVDAAGAAVAGASVNVRNTSVSPSINFTTFTDLTGAVLVPGAPTSTAYQILVTKDGYSSAQTYARDAINQNPTPGYFTVAKNQTTSGTFAIDALASLVLRTFSPVRAATSQNRYADASGLTEQTATQVTANTLRLAGSPGLYPFSGSARSTTTAPQYVKSWTSLAVSEILAPNTGIRMFITDASGMLLPDSALAGNSAGFTSFPVSLADVSTTTYPSLAFRAELTSTDGLNTPQLVSATFSYEEGPVPLPNVPITLTGSKRKGTTGSGTPLYKTIVSTTTDATGVRTIPLEWDAYQLEITGYTMQSPSSTPSYVLAPGTTLESVLILQ